MKKSIVILLIILISSSLSADDFSSMTGICPPYPVSFEKHDIVGARPYLKYDVETILYLTIDSTGKVTKVESEQPKYRGYAAYLMKYFSQYTFKTNCENGFSKLPVEIAIPKDSGLYSCRWPMGGEQPDGSFITKFKKDNPYMDNFLYLKFLEVNNHILPKIKYFPSYFSPIQDDDTMYTSPLLLFSLHVNTGGSVDNINSLNKPKKKYYYPYASQLLSAIHYAEFYPAEIDSTQVEVDICLAVVFYPSISYPTPPFQADEEDTYGIYLRNSLMVVPSPAGLVRRPLLRQETSFPQSALKYIPDTIAVPVSIDSMGYASLMKMPEIDSTYHDLFRRNINKLRFWPALLADGRGIEFRGLLYLQPKDSTSIRITPAWLMF